MSAPIYNTKYESGSHNDRYYTNNRTFVNNNDFITYRSKNNYYNTNIEVKRSSRSGGYFLRSVSGVSSIYNKFFYLTDGLTTLRLIFILLLLGNFVRSLTNDNPLFFTGLLHALSDIKTIPTGWISDLSHWIRSGLINNVSGVSSWAGAMLKLVGFLIYPLPSICYLLIGLLNVIWFLFNIITIFGGSLII